MRNYLPLLIAGGIIGVFATLAIVAYCIIIRQKEDMTDRERNMSDKEIVSRLLRYAKPYWKNFIAVFFIMLFSIGYDLIAPLMMAHIQDVIKEDGFELKYLFSVVAFYAGILAVSLLCTYLQAMILQKTGQKILSQIRLDVFTHVEKLSHEQLNSMPVGKLVTRVTNDPNAISFMFTNIIVTLAKNSMVIVGILVVMLAVNYTLTLRVLCFVPFVVLFTVIFRQFSRRVHRAVSNATTDINTYLSENLSGMKITQIFNREEQKMQDFMGRSSKLKKAKYNRMYVFGIFRPMVYTISEQSKEPSSEYELTTKLNVHAIRSFSSYTLVVHLRLLTNSPRASCSTVKTSVLVPCIFEELSITLALSSSPSALAVTGTRNSTRSNMNFAR